MSERRRVTIRKLTTGVPGLDPMLGGGLPEYSFNLIAGEPGSGKTTLVQQIIFANATPDRPALYFTVMGEPPLKMLRYQQQFSFFDPDKVDGAIRFINLSEEATNQGLNAVFDAIVREVEKTLHVGIVVVDSFRSALRTALGTPQDQIQAYIQQLALRLSSWQATTFLIGEYLPEEIRDNPAFTVADGIIWLYQSVERNSMVRKLQVVKMRGQGPMPGLATFRINSAGIQVFPRLFQPSELAEKPQNLRLSSGVSGLDEMMSGGVPQGDSVLVAGPSGSGKTVLSMQFIAAGVRQNERGVIAVFEEHPRAYVERARTLGIDLQPMIDAGQVRVLYLHPVDLSVDEILSAVQSAVDAIGARRVVIDSLSAIELALAPGFRDDFREGIYRMMGVLTGLGVTVLMTVEVTESYTSLSFSPHAISFLTDDLVLQRFVELDSQLQRVITVIKMRGSAHSDDIRVYTITSSGIVVGGPLTNYHGVITGVPVPRPLPEELTYPGLTEAEILVLRALSDVPDATVDGLSDRTGLKRAPLIRILDRLVDLAYATRVTEGERAIYRTPIRPDDA